MALKSRHQGERGGRGGDEDEGTRCCSVLWAFGVVGVDGWACANLLSGARSLINRVGRGGDQPEVC